MYLQLSPGPEIATFAIFEAQKRRERQEQKLRAECGTHGPQGTFNLSFMVQDSGLRVSGFGGTVPLLQVSGA